MEKDNLLKLLKEKIDYIVELQKVPNQDSLRQWREETLMILDSLISEESKYYSNFEKISYTSGVYSMGDPEGNRLRDEEAAKAGLEKAKSSLNAIVFGVNQGLF